MKTKLKSYLTTILTTSKKCVSKIGEITSIYPQSVGTIAVVLTVLELIRILL